jgi:hypothetical protein
MTLPDKKTLALQTLKTMQGYANAGVSRTSDPAQVERFLALFDLPMQQGGVYVPFCAAGLCYAMVKSLAELIGDGVDMDTLKSLIPILSAHYLTPSASCGALMADLKIRGLWVPKSEIDTVEPGWITFWAWNGGQAPEHVGDAEDEVNDIISDFEDHTSSASNANGGACARRARTEDCLLGVGALYR